MATLAVLPSVVPSETPEPSDTPTETLTFTPSPRATWTPTATLTPSATPTNTATLSTRVFGVEVVNPGVTLVGPSPTTAPSGTPTPFPTMDVPLPPPTAVISLAATSKDELGWVRFEDDDQAI